MTRCALCHAACLLFAAPGSLQARLQAVEASLQQQREQAATRRRERTEQLAAAWDD